MARPRVASYHVVSGQSVAPFVSLAPQVVGALYVSKGGIRVGCHLATGVHARFHALAGDAADTPDRYTPGRATRQARELRLLFFSNARYC